MKNSRIFTKSVAIVLAMVIGLTFSPVKSYAESNDNNDSQNSTASSNSSSSSTSTGLIVGGVVVVGLLSYFFLFRNNNHQASVAPSDIYSNLARNYSTEKEHSNKSILFEHESPFLVASLAK